MLICNCIYKVYYPSEIILILSHNGTTLERGALRYDLDDAIFIGAFIKKQ